MIIDQGGHASRVVVFDGQGTPLAGAVRAVGVQQPQPGWVEQDADEIVQSVREALADTVGQLGADAQRIQAAGLATQRSNIVCWDRATSAALSSVISWQDRRAQEWMQSFVHLRVQIRSVTGLLPSAHYGVSKIHWCLEQLAAVKAARDQSNLAIAPLASFLLSRLLKENPFVVDAVNASRTLLWDWRRRAWSLDLLRVFDLTDEYLPQGVANRYPFGQLEIAGTAIPLTVCTGDQSSALFVSGKPKVGMAYINIGTGAFLQCVAKIGEAATETPSQKNLLRSIVWDDGDDSIQVLEATVNGAGSALLSMAHELGFAVEDAQQQYATWLATKKNIPLYLNGISGLGSPFWLPQFVSQFVGPLADDAQPAEKMVGVLESIVFLLCLNLQEMQRAGVVVQHITISGGLSVLDGVCQRLADVSQLPVLRAPHTEATAQGLAFLLIKPERAWDSDDKFSRFLPQDNQALGERYRHWQRAMLNAVNDYKPSASEKLE